VIGLPQLWHLPNLLESWFEPVFEVSHHQVQWHEFPITTEWTLMFTSIIIAVVGILAATALYRDAKSAIPEKLRTKYASLHKIVFNKYYVDELYQATVISGTVLFSKISGWFDNHIIDGLVNLVGYITRVFSKLNGLNDIYVIDGAVNGIAAISSKCGKALRTIQTGRIQTYLYGLLIGGLVLVILRFIIFS
jgi:NADH-quinone oxidoreductase subunit L